MRLPDPSRSMALLWGTSSFEDPALPDLPSVRRNIVELAATLTSPSGTCLPPESCVTLLDESDPAVVGRSLITVAKQAEDLLLVYYAGHGVIGADGQLYLSLSGTSSDRTMVSLTAVSHTFLRRVLAEARADNRVLILDCCFSGQAIDVMTDVASVVAGQLEVAGTCTLTSSPANLPAMAPSGERFTAYTGELLELLRNGSDDDAEYLTLQAVHEHLARILPSKGFPRPEQRNTHTVARLALTRNHRHPIVPTGSVSRRVQLPLGVSLEIQRAARDKSNDAPKIPPRLKRSQLRGLVLLGAGFQSKVYTSPGTRMSHAESMVYKEYKPDCLPGMAVSVLDEMLAFLESLSYQEGMGILSLAAWPCRLVEDDISTAVIGFVMPAIPPQFRISVRLPSGAVAQKNAEFEHLLNPESVLARHGITLTDRNRYELLATTARALNTLHRHNISVGDLSPKNILFSLVPNPAVYFIDCDDMRFRSRSVHPQVETPGWEVIGVNPNEELATPQSDAYKFGLLALRLFAGDQLTSDFGTLPLHISTPVRKLVAATLSAKPIERPAPADWIDALTDAARIA